MQREASAPRAERWLLPGAEFAQRRPMPEEWYSGWDAQAGAGQLGVAADEAGAPSWRWLAAAPVNLRNGLPFGQSGCM